VRRRPGNRRLRGRLEVALSCLGIVVTAFAAVQVGRELAAILDQQISTQRWGAVALHVLFCTIVAWLIYGGLVYLLTRALCYVRKCRHVRERSEELEEILGQPDAPLLTILVPSYKEEPQVVLRTLLSAALQTYPRRRIALLIDDPPFPDNPADRAALDATRTLPESVATLLREPHSWIEACTGIQANEPAPSADQVTELLERVSRWFESLAGRFDHTQHEEKLFAERILLAHAEDCRNRALQIEAACRRGEESALCALLQSSCLFLRGLFVAELHSFERKQFENLSHEINKAMNLNSYIGLIGKSFAIEHRGGKRFLVPAPAQAADLQFPDSDYIITLDADSVILPDYALRLIHFLQRPGNERVAVVQTPYSAFPGAPNRLQRLAGATTDVQYIIHQGFTACSGTYWVGANALLRKRALDDIAERETEWGYPITRYIQDRTVIEDTESSIDLVARGWSLHNYPERLAFSSTPPDFGSLLIQRRRWANGGLIILPKLLKYLAGNALRFTAWLEGFVRVHYLVSVSAVNLGLLIVLAIPFTENIRSWWLPVTAVPYFSLYARDLKLWGYRYRDVLGVYALNLLLIPVNLGGVLKSIQQMWTRTKIPFGRTPKVRGRTAAGALYVAAVYVLLLQWLIAAGLDFYHGRIFHGSFAVVNAGFLAYAAVYLVGISECWEDIKTACAPKIWGLVPHAFDPVLDAPSPLAEAPTRG
jgi:cellulose synthase/poly-beta-1,6-N-acetylglucosamine synthase-like glycosyltransferase